MSKLPFGECPDCRHPLWDNDADLKGRNLEQIHTVCIYCGEAMRFDICAGKYVKLELDRLPYAERLEIRVMQVMAKMAGPQLIDSELRRRNKNPQRES